MSTKVIPCIYNAPKMAMPALRGRSGTHYGSAAWNDKTARHECPPIDAEYYDKVVLPDMAKMDERMTERWMISVQVGKDSDEVDMLKAELDAANSRIRELLTQQPAKTELPFNTETLVERSEDAAQGVPASPADVDAMNYRELRAHALSLKLPVKSGMPKADLLALVKGETVPA